MRMRLAALLAGGTALLATACREEAITRSRVPKTEAAASGVDAPHEHDHERAPRARGLRWTLPSGWKEVAGGGMRLATLLPPGGPTLGPGGPTLGPGGLKTEVTVVALPGDSGGELANVNRWRGQIGLPPTDEAGMAASRTLISTKAGPATIHDFTGAGAARARIIAAAVDTGGTTWFFKLMGDAAATEAARGDFLTLIKGLAPDAPN